MFTLEVRELAADERAWASRLLAARWGSPRILVHNREYAAEQLPALVAASPLGNLGLVTYHLSNGECEIVTLDSIAEGQGVGAALLAAVETLAHTAGCRRVFVVTTNDNLKALRFYQRRGYVLATLYRDAVTASRQRKPEIPLVGGHGIEIRDELEMEKTTL